MVPKVSLRPVKGKSFSPVLNLCESHGHGEQALPQVSNRQVQDQDVPKKE
jgi:hypothetical protein